MNNLKREPIATDVENIRLLKQGDEGALDQLWHALFSDSLKISRKYGQSKDLGYDAAVRAYEKLRRYGIANFAFRSSFRSYCWTIIAGELFRLMKKEPKTVELDLETVKHPVAIDDIKTVSVQTIAERIQPCIDQLKGNRLKVFQLVDLERRRPGEVAEELGLSRNNVSKLVSRARLDIRRCLEKRGYKEFSDVLTD